MRATADRSLRHGNLRLLRTSQPSGCQSKDWLDDGQQLTKQCKGLEMQAATSHRARPAAIAIDLVLPVGCAQIPPAGGSIARGQLENRQSKRLLERRAQSFRSCP